MWFWPLISRGRRSPRNRATAQLVLDAFLKATDLFNFSLLAGPGRSREAVSCLRLKDLSCDGGLADGIRGPEPNIPQPVIMTVPGTDLLPRHHGQGTGPGAPGASFLH